MSTLTEVENAQWMVNVMHSLIANKPQTSVLEKEFMIYSEIFHQDVGTDITDFVIKEILKEIKGDIT